MADARRSTEAAQGVIDVWIMAARALLKSKGDSHALNCLRANVWIRNTVLIAKETRFAVMATLYDVQRDILEVNALSARYELILSEDKRA